MRFSIIIPAHNEEATLAFCLQSLQAQSYPHFEVMVVDDGSSDKTSQIIEAFSFQDSRFRGISLSHSVHSPGEKVVKTFYEGLKSIDVREIICKFDADIVFPSYYLEKIAQSFEEDRDLGMVSGVVFIPVSDVEISDKLLDFSSEEGWRFEAISSRSHVRGPIKAYRKECFFAMNGLREVLGWDNIDVMLAEKHGFSVKTLPTLWVKHLRPTAYLYQEDKYKKLGKYFRNIGLSFSLAVISAVKVAWQDGRFKALWGIIISFVSTPRSEVLTLSEVRFIRQFRWKKFWETFKRGFVRGRKKF